MTRNLFTILCTTILLSGCADKKEIERLTKLGEDLKQENRSLKVSLTKAQQSRDRLDFLATQLGGIQARIVTNRGNIEVRFFPDKAPLHCFSFITRAEGGFYDNTQFHRVVPGFMIQGGDPNSKDSDPRNDGGGGPIVNIPHEFNDTRHTRGILSTARVGNKAVGAGSQFFLMHAPDPNLDGDYTVFGEVTSGMDVVDKIATAERDGTDHPVKPVVIKTIEVYS